MKKLRTSCLTLALIASCTVLTQTQQADIPLPTRSHHPWRAVQQHVKDTVVQIFAFRFEKDIIEPYMMPYQRASRGSGFFIRYEGNIFIVTNAHVVDQAGGIHIRIPSLGQRPITAVLVSICHDRDLALLKIVDEEIEFVIQGLGGVIPYLELGDSNNIYRADEVLALGYPLGQEALKSTTGVISGVEDQFIQMSAPINPGSSGGPLLNENGEVIGVNSAGIDSVDGRVVQNVGYCIPINRLKIILPQMLRSILVKKPSLGIVSSHASNMAECLGNPLPSGSYLSEILPASPLDKAGIQKDDMIYKINGYCIDDYGDITVPWSEDRISIVEYISSIGLEDDINVVVYRNGERIECTVHFGTDFETSIKRIYPGYEELDYELFGGMVVMQLTLNHIEILGQRVPGLKDYAKLKNQYKPVLVVTHVLPTSALFLTRTIGPGVVLSHVNDMAVSTLDDFRVAIKKTRLREFLTMRGCDTVGGLTDNIRVALRSSEVILQESLLAEQYGYTLSEIVKEIIGS